VCPASSVPIETQESRAPLEITKVTLRNRQSKESSTRERLRCDAYRSGLPPSSSDVR
jgi:hypothetical protein